MTGHVRGIAGILGRLCPVEIRFPQELFKISQNLFSFLKLGKMVDDDVEHFRKEYARLSVDEGLVGYQFTITVNAAKLRWSIREAERKLFKKVISIIDNKRDPLMVASLLVAHEYHKNGYPHIHMLVYFFKGLDESRALLGKLRQAVGNTFMKVDANSLYVHKDSNYDNWCEYILKDVDQNLRYRRSLEYPGFEEFTRYSNLPFIICTKDYVHLFDRIRFQL